MSKNVFDEVRDAAAAGNALILGPGAVHNLQIEIERLEFRINELEQKIADINDARDAE